MDTMKYMKNFKGVLSKGAIMTESILEGSMVRVTIHADNKLYRAIFNSGEAITLYDFFERLMKSSEVKKCRA